MSGGECKVFSPAPHVILGKTQTDQNWIDGEVEAGIGGCGFPRPAPRPEALDAPPKTSQIAADPAPIQKPRKKGFFRRLKERVALPKSRPVVAQPVPAATPEPSRMEPQPATPVEAPRRDPVLEFLNPKG